MGSPVRDAGWSRLSLLLSLFPLSLSAGLCHASLSRRSPPRFTGPTTPLLCRACQHESCAAPSRMRG
ncbi:hypothetical protein AAHA92_06304 [Salvia divinorum]|uniref:Secreted protein n=1 Tax=Salvia divinorum TaxID=28513 RepID=A0ABD1I6B9_SALDI